MDDLAELTRLEPFRNLDEAELRELWGELRLVHLPAGAILFSQGEAGDSLYWVLRGRLEVRVSAEDASETQVDVLEPGASVGEMALLTGQPRAATVSALEDTQLLELSKAGFDRLVRKRPQTLQALIEAMRPRLQRAHWVDVLEELFGELDAQKLRELQEFFQWKRLSGGEMLFEQGEASQAMYLVVYGRLRIVVREEDGSVRVVGEVGRGESVGEWGLLSGDPRSATVYAMRDSEVLELSRSRLGELLERYPGAILRLAEMSARRAQRSSRRSSSRLLPTPTLTLLPLRPEVPTGWIESLVEALEELGPTLYLDSERFERAYGKAGAAQSSLDDPASTAILAWLNEQETRHRYVLYQADPTPSSWTQRCLRQADRILLVGLAEADPTPGEVDRALRGLRLQARVELLLLHPASTPRPVGTQAWLAARQVDDHHHLRLGDSQGVRRLARRVSGHAVGLVLGGGGARGFAHIGVIRALEEAGIPIDLIGGTSMGALIGAGYTLGHTPQQMLEQALAFASRRRLLDYTLPVTSLFASGKLTALLRSLFADTRIEDLWRPYFCVSTNLSRAQPVLHRQGPLWEAVRASTAIPGVFSPILYQGDVLVDGGVMNNCPVDLMRQACGHGVVIGVSVSPLSEKAVEYAFGPSLSGWQVFFSRFFPFARPIRAPSLVGTLMRATAINSAHHIKAVQEMADVFIQPSVGRFGILDFENYEQIAQAGYESARPHIQAWKTTWQKLA